MAARPPLTSHRIIEAALGVADAGGVRALTMRRIAEGLGVEAMALYHHLPNKAAILDRVVGAVYEEMGLPQPGSDWRAALITHGHDTRSAIAAHPWILGLIESRGTVTPARLRRHDAMLGVLFDAGFCPSDAVQVASLLDSYVYGFVLQEAEHRAPAAGDLQLAAQALIASEPGLEHLCAVAGAAVAGDIPSYDATFSRGLHLVLDGCSKWLPT